jgi:AraC-like DNA-binding protein
MHYRQYAPDPRLAGHVECYWHMRRPAGGPPDRILPDGCMELIVNLGQPFSQMDETGRFIAQPRVFLVGQITRHLLLRASAAVEVLAVRFKPGGAHSLLRFDLGELTDDYAPLAQLGRPWSSLAAQLDCAASPAAALRLIEAALLRHLPAHGQSGHRVARALGLLAEAEEAPRVAGVARRLGVSERQLERDFRRQIGLSPRQFGRITRFRRMLSALDGANPRWADLAARIGYSDQSHLIREFRDIAGLTPREYLADRTPFASALIG